MAEPTCFHCGNPCGSDSVHYNNKSFCCNGCKTVFQIFKDHNLDYYYELEAGAGQSPNLDDDKYDYLDDPNIAEKLLDFQDGIHHVVNLSIPQIHCSSCIWVLENLHKLHPGVLSSQVDFPKRQARIHFDSQKLCLKALIQILSAIGYEPAITLEQYHGKPAKNDRTLIYQLGVAGFAFGNIMFLSFPEYFETGEFWIEKYKVLFRWIMFAFSLPVVFYAGSGYLKTAYKGLKAGILNIDVPIALGILVLFIRSTVEISMDWGSGFFDSLAGLIFFLLLGKYFQRRTYSYLSFERDYKSYFPIAATVIQGDGNEVSVPVYEIQKGDVLLIRNNSLIPADSILKKGIAEIDYSFVTGEARPVRKKAGDRIYAGGKQIQGIIEVEVLKPVSQSYLTELWSDDAFSKAPKTSFQNLTDRIGKRFTAAVLSLAVIASGIWLFIDPAKAGNVFTAVLIIACPCALALAAPFTLGNLLRIFGTRGFYVKDTQTLERMAQIDTLIFDKTGTLSTTQKNEIEYAGIPLSEQENAILKNILRSSGHPLSQTLYRQLAPYNIVPLDAFEEHIGLGVEGTSDGFRIKAGSLNFVNAGGDENTRTTQVHIASNDAYKGCFTIRNSYREGVRPLFDRLSTHFELAVLSGDNAGERDTLETLLPPLTPMYFDQKPNQKLEFVKDLQQNHKRVGMIGDGLNDAGALAQSDVGIAVSEDANLFTPACDAILDSRNFNMLDAFMNLSKAGIRIIHMSFALSLVYNIIGLYFAVTGQLQPVIAAILMPLSSISVVVFTTVATNMLGKRLPSAIPLNNRKP